MGKQKNETTTRTCHDCLHCKACYLWNNGAISDSVASKCPQFDPARYATLAELHDLYRMYKGELVPVVRCRECRHHDPAPAAERTVYCTHWDICVSEGGYCHCGEMDGGAEDE